MKFIGTKGTRLKQLQGQGVTFIIRISKAAYKKTIDAGGFINYTPSPVLRLLSFNPIVVVVVVVVVAGLETPPIR